MWRGESCANGCLSGWKFIPGTQETGKQKTRKNEQLILFGLTQLQKPRENKKTSFDLWRGSEGKLDRWHGVKLFVFCCFFSIGFGAFLGQGGKNLEKTKKTKSLDPWRRSEGKLDRWHGVKLFVFIGLSMVLDQFLPLSESGLFVWEFVIDPSFRNGSRSADRMIWSRQCKICAFRQCARLHPPWSSLLYCIFSIHRHRSSTWINHSKTRLDQVDPVV